MTEGKGFNHHPTETGIWFGYNGWRYKDRYDITLMDGALVSNCYPNGCSWVSVGDGKDFKDSDVGLIRLKPDEELGKWCFKGTDRIKRNCEMFNIPPDIESFERHI